MHQAEPQSRQWAATQPREQFDDRDWRWTLFPGLFALLAFALCLGLVVFVDTRRDDVSLPPGADLLDDALPGAVEPARMFLEEDRVGGDRLATTWQFTKYGRLEIAVVGQRDGARD